MAEQDKPLNVRVPAELLERVNKFADHRRKWQKGMRLGSRYTRSDAVRHLLERALSNAGFD